MTVMSSTMPHRENGWAGQGAVLLDIGGDVGALVVQMPGAMVGLEVEIRPLDGRQQEHLAHVAVVARPVSDGRVPSLVFPELAAGRYELFEKGRPHAVALGVEVTGGAVTSASWGAERRDEPAVEPPARPRRT